MKAFVFIKIGIIFLCLTSCGKSYRMITIVEKDGSFQRIVYAKSDSAFFLLRDMSKNPFMFDIDSNWIFIEEKMEMVDKNGNKTWMQGISRQFKSFDEFSEKLKFHEINRPLSNPKESLNKKFKWFYTYHTFNANYQRIMADLPVPLDKYMTETEQKLMFHGDLQQYAGWNGIEISEDLDELGKKFKNWYAHNLFEIYFNSIYQIATKHNFKYATQMPEIKDSLYQLNIKKIKSVENIEITDIVYMLDDFFNTSDFSSFYDSYNKEMEYYTSLFSTDIFGNEINYELILPGKIIQTNAPVISGDTLKWKMDAYRILPSDYVLSAQTRTANIWAFVVTALLGLISVYCLKFSRKK